MKSDVVTYYNIRRPYPFVNVDVFVDMPLVVDPQAIRLSSSPQPFAREAIYCLESFWSLVVQYVRDGSELALAQAELLLGSFKEPKENRMGVTCGGISGRGSAHVIAKRIVAVLTHEAYGLMQAGSVGQIDLVPLFVRGIGRDIMSDITTRIAFGPLVSFTQWVTDTYPEFSTPGHRVSLFRRQVWDPSAGQWLEKEMMLPVAGGNPLLLVPNEWVRSDLLMSANRFYKTKVLDFVQQTKAAYLPDRKLHIPTKKELRAYPNLHGTHKTNIRVTLQALDAGDDLVSNFQDHVNKKWNMRHSSKAA